MCAISLNRGVRNQVPRGHRHPPRAAPASSPGLTLDNQLHIPMLRAGRVADHTAVPAGVLQQRLVKVEAAVCPDGMPAARWELVWAKKNQLGPRVPLRAAKRTPETSLPTSPAWNSLDREVRGLQRWWGPGGDIPIPSQVVMSPHGPSGPGGSDPQHTLDPARPRCTGPGQDT